MISIFIIEDEVQLQIQLQKYIADLPGFHVVGTAPDVSSAIALIDLNKPQIILSDIQLFDGTSFDVLSAIRHQNYTVIFITAYDNYALKAIKFGALDYLLKPVDKTELYDALEKIADRQNFVSNAAEIQNSIQQYKTGNTPRLVIRTMNVAHFLALDDIIYCSSEGNYTTFVMVGGEKIMATRNIKEYELLLPEHTFLRPHRSYIVNINFVKQMHSNGTLHLTNCSDIIPVSTRKKELIMELLSNNK